MNPITRKEDLILYFAGAVALVVVVAGIALSVAFVTREEPVGTIPAEAVSCVASLSFERADVTSPPEFSRIIEPGTEARVDVVLNPQGEAAIGADVYVVFDPNQVNLGDANVTLYQDRFSSSFYHFNDQNGGNKVLGMHFFSFSQNSGADPITQKTTLATLTFVPETQANQVALSFLFNGCGSSGGSLVAIDDQGTTQSALGSVEDVVFDVQPIPTATLAPTNTPVPTPTPEPRQSPCPPYGDVDNDGTLSVADMELILQAGVGQATLTQEQQTRADVTADGEVNVFDATFIGQYLARERDTFPICSTITPTPTPIPLSPTCEALYDRVVDAFNKSCGETGYDKIADLNNDKIVDIFDYNLIVQYAQDENWCNGQLNDGTDPCAPPTTTPTPTPEPRQSPCSPYGDVNNDGTLSTIDIELIMQAGVGEITLTQEQQLRADVTADGGVNVFDATFIGQYLAGERDTFPICTAVTPTSTSSPTPTLTPTATPIPVGACVPGDLSRCVTPDNSCVDVECLQGTCAYPTLAYKTPCPGAESKICVEGECCLNSIDYQCDQQMDIEDFRGWVGQFRDYIVSDRSVESLQRNYRADLNGDGTIDIFDFVEFVKIFRAAIL